MIFDARMRSNIFALYAVQGLNYLISFATFPFLTRTLGENSFGLMGLAFSVIQYGVLLTDFGFNLSATREIAQVRDDPAAVARIFWRTTWIKTLLMLLSCLALLIPILLLPDWRAHWQAYLVSFLYILSSVLYPIWYFQGLEELRKSSFLMVVMRGLMLGVLLWAVQGPGDVVLAIALQAAPQLLAGLFWLATGWGLPRPPLTGLSWPDARQALLTSCPFFLSALSTSLYTTSTTVILGSMASLSEVGRFNTANKLTYTVQGLIGLFVQAVYPRIAQLAATNKPEALRLIRYSWWLQGGAGLLMTLILAIGAPWLMPWLFKMPEAVMPQIWAAPTVVLGALSYIYGLQTLVVFGYERYYSKVLVSAGILNIVLVVGLLLLPYADKASLAAMAVSLVEAYIVFAFWWRARSIYQEIRA